MGRAGRATALALFSYQAAAPRVKLLMDKLLLGAPRASASVAIMIQLSDPSWTAIWPCVQHILDALHATGALCDIFCISPMGVEGNHDAARNHAAVRYFLAWQSSGVALHAGLLLQQLLMVRQLRLQHSFLFTLPSETQCKIAYFCSCVMSLFCL